jgi:hypothetical protein
MKRIIITIIIASTINGYCGVKPIGYKPTPKPKPRTKNELAITSIEQKAEYALGIAWDCNDKIRRINKDGYESLIQKHRYFMGELFLTYNPSKESLKKYKAEKSKAKKKQEDAFRAEINKQIKEWDTSIAKGKKAYNKVMTEFNNANEFVQGQSKGYVFQLFEKYGEFYANPPTGQDVFGKALSRTETAIRSLK